MNTVKGTKKLTSANTMTNAVSFLVEESMWSRINTAEVVCIDKADQQGTDESAGYASATPLVCPVDGGNNTVMPVSIHKLPYFRPQAGKAAIVMDPQPGDKAILVAMKRDSSTVTTETKTPVQPGSFRTFDQADGFLINGFLGEQPEIWLHLNPVSGDISLSTKKANIDISCRESGDIEIKTGDGNILIEATGEITVTAPDIKLDGNVRITGNLTIDGNTTGFEGGRARFDNGLESKTGITNTGGSIVNSGGVIESNGIVLDTHIHRCPDGNTSAPR